MDSPKVSWRPRRVVCATDLSRGSAMAMARAAHLAREFGAVLHLVHVVPVDLWADLSKRLADALGEPVPSEETLRGNARVELKALSKGAREMLGGDAVIEVRSGRPAVELVRYASEVNANLVVVGAHGEHPVRDLMLGTTVQKLLRTSPCPVLVVKSPPESSYASILVPTDLSDAAREALVQAAEAFPAASLHVGHAFELPYDGQMRYAAIDESAVAHFHAAARERLLVELQEWADAAGVPAPRRRLYVEHGYPSTRIAKWIKRLRIDLVVLPARGKSTIEETFLGSVSLHTALTAPCDVLLMRHAADKLPSIQH